MRLSAVVFALVVVGLASCSEEKQPLLSLSIDEGIASNSFEEMQSIVDQEAATNGFAGFTSSATSFKTSSDCPEVGFSAPMGTFPNTMTIDFGDGCSGYFGVERSGKIISTFTGPYPEAGTIITTTTEDYYVEGNLVEGTRSVTNMGINAAGNIWFEVLVSDGHIALASGEDIYFEANRQREWVEGGGALPVWDDVYLISGTGSGINRMGIPYTMEITDSIRKEISCRWPVSGSKLLMPEGYPERSINYGDGSCDNLITVTVDGVIYEIELPM